MKQYHEALFLSYRPRTECSISQFCNTNCTHSIFRTIEARVSETVKKISKINYTANRFSLLTSAKVHCLNKHSYTLQHNGFITMCNLQKRLIRAAFWLLLQAMFMSDWKQTAQRLKLQKRLLSLYCQVITKFSGMGRFTHPWCSAGALRAPGLRYKLITSNWTQCTLSTSWSQNGNDGSSILVVLISGAFVRSRMITKVSTPEWYICISQCPQ